jgi:hypothetical protein
MTPWVITKNGKRLDPTDVQPDQLDIEEIAHALANINRFNGHTKWPISVAQHSVYVSRLVGDGVPGLQGLLHDASEYVLGDITKWLKHTPAFDRYRETEDRIQRVIYAHFGCPEEMLPEVAAADKLMVRVEGEAMWGPNWSDVPGYGPLTEDERAPVGKWEPWTWSFARHHFLERFKELRDGSVR